MEQTEQTNQVETEHVQETVEKGLDAMMPPVIDVEKKIQEMLQ